MSVGASTRSEGFPKGSMPKRGPNLSISIVLMATYIQRFGLKRAPELLPYVRAVFAGQVIPFGEAAHADLPDAITLRLSASNLFQC